MIMPIPVLFADLLNHWGTKGPLKFCVWVASRLGVDSMLGA
jgi:hypothetical protein